MIKMHSKNKKGINKMKKNLSLVLLLGVLILGLTGCNSNLKAKIIDNEGKRSEMTASELVSIYTENEAKFQKYYFLASVELTSTIESIDLVKSTSAAYISLSGNWRILADKDKIDLADLDKGTKIRVRGVIVDKWNNDITITGKGSNAGDREKVEIQIIK